MKLFIRIRPFGSCWAVRLSHLVGEVAIAEAVTMGAEIEKRAAKVAKAIGAEVVGGGARLGGDGGRLFVNIHTKSGPAPDETQIRQVFES